MFPPTQPPLKPASGAKFEKILLSPVFKIGKKCREWFHSLQDPEAAGLRNMGVHLMGQSTLCPPFTIARPHSKFDALWLLEEGTMRLTLSSGVLSMRAGEAWAIPADSLSRMELISRTARMTWLHLDPGSLPPLLNPGQANRIPASTPVISRVRLYLEILREEGAASSLESRQVRHKVFGLVELELQRLLRAGQNPGNHETASRMRQIWEEVEHSTNYGWDVPTMACKANLSPSRFHALCIELFGMTPHEKITQIRMNRAMGRLLASHEKIEAIAKECGYSTLCAFSKTFTKIVGMRPKAFREKHT